MSRLNADMGAQLVEALGLGMEHLDKARVLIDRASVVDRTGEVFRAGEVAEELFVLVQVGQSVQPRIKLGALIPSRADPVTVMWIVEGVFGEFEFVRRGPHGFPLRSLSCFAPLPVRVVRVPYSSILELDPDVRGMIDRRLTLEALERADLVMERFALAKVTTKSAQLAQTVLDLVDDAGINEGAGRRVDMKITQQDLANEVGLTREAVNQNVREWEHAGLIQLTPAQLRIQDWKRFKSLVQAGFARSREAHRGFLENINALSANGNNFRARNMALDGITHFPNSMELKYQAFLAAIRTGSLTEAGRFLDQMSDGVSDPGDLREMLERSIRTGTIMKAGSGPLDVDDEDADAEAEFNRKLGHRLNTLFEDVLSAPARLLKERALGNHKEADRTLVAAAARAYEDVYKKTLGNFPAINSATLFRIAGEERKAADIANTIRRALDKSAVTYWDFATLGEAYLLTGDLKSARESFARALQSPGASPGKIATTRLQLKRVASALGMREMDVLDLLPQGGVVVFSGHLTRAPEDLTTDMASELRKQIAERFKSWRVAEGFGALGAGADTLFADALLSIGAKLNIVLPFHADDFFKLSFEGLVSPSEAGAFQRIMRASSSLRVLTSDRLDKIRRTELNERFYHGNRQMLGLAMLRADELMAPLKLCALSNGELPQSIAGTAYLADLARSLGVDVDVVDCPWRQPVKRSSPFKPEDTKFHAPVVFLWEDLSRGDARPNRLPLASSLSGWPPSCWSEDYSRARARVDVQAHCFDTVEEALDKSCAIVTRAASSGARLRIVCDFGAVKPDGRKADEVRVRRLIGADEGLQMPWGEIAASEAFAAEVRLARNSGVKCWPAGRVLVSGKLGGGRPVSSIPMYQLQW